MAMRIVFLNGQETTVTGTEDEMVRRGHSDQVKLAGVDGVVRGVIRAHVTLVGPRPSPVP
jgi:hypothetical protein